jgi:sensor histidine kinase YesM
MTIRSVFIKYKLHHLLFWGLAFAIWYYLRYQDYRTKTIAIQVTLLKVADLALMIYLTNYLLIPKLLYKKLYLWFLLAFVAMIVTSSVSKMYLIGQIMNRPDLFSLSGNLKARVYDNIIPHFFLVIAGVAFKLLLDYTRAQRRLADMVKEKAEAELNFLKSQINPHFLFNSLNSVYFLIDKSNPEARQALHKFSEMLRYQLYEASGEKIPIEKEIVYLRDYVDLQKLRKDEKYFVQFNCATDVKDFLIEPLLLIPFVENAFKHISHNSEKSNFVKLDLNKSNGVFEFSVTNSKSRNEVTTEQHGGIGLNNVKRRLELLYPEKHELNISNEENEFKVDLKINV